MTFNGAKINERMDVSANGGRVRFTRDVANIVMDLDDVESIVARTLGGVDTLTVDDLSGTDATSVVDDEGADDGVADTVIANATAGDDVATISGGAGSAEVTGLGALVGVTNATGADRLQVNGLAGDDVLDASIATAGAPLLTL